MTVSIAGQPLRIAVRTTGRVSARAIARLADEVGEQVPRVSGGARVRPVDAPTQGRDWLVEVDAEEPIGAPGYASSAWDLAHRLRDSGIFELVEADVPVTAYAPFEAAVDASTSADCADDLASNGPGWALDAIGWAGATARMDPAVRGGVGIRVGHPDSGYSDHFALGSVVDVGSDWDIIDNDDDATDPLRPPRRHFLNPLPNPGHGTSTASVILGAGDQNGFHGVAPRAVLVPFRATESVVQIFDSDVADAVRRARRTGCHIVSMSLGGTGFFGLREAIQEAVDDGMIVMAAAGNQVGVVTAPASYDNCLAVAATGTGDRPWSGSSRGSAVDVSAPGSCVWAALFDWRTDPPGRVVDRSHGTSYAVAHLAGVAALWLAHHGHQALCDRYGPGGVQSAFLRLLRTPGVCARPVGWDDDWGIGRIDADALLGAPLPEVTEPAGVRALAAGAADDPVSRLAALTSTPSARVRTWLVSIVGSDDTEARARRFEGELAYLVLSDPGFRAGLTSPGLRALRVTLPPAASPQLRAVLGT